MTMQMASGELVPEWTVQDRMRKARELRGLTQAEFAEETGLSRSTIRRVESGDKAVGRKEFNLWRMATGVSRVWLETGQTPPTDGGPVGPVGIEPTRSTV